jgi:hypothetical protein
LVLLEPSSHSGSACTHQYPILFQLQVVAQLLYVSRRVQQCPTRLRRAQTESRSLWTDNASSDLDSVVVKMSSFKARCRVAVKKEDWAASGRAILCVSKLSSVFEDERAIL